MIPKLIRIYKANDGSHVNIYDNGIISTAFEVDHLDYEKPESNKIHLAIEAYLQSISQGLTFKFKSTTQRFFDDIAPNCKRNEAVKYLGWTGYKLIIFVEKEIPRFKNLLKSLFKNKIKESFLDEFIEDFLTEINVNALKSMGLRVSPHINEISFEDSFIKQSSSFLSIDSSFLSIIKLHKLGNYESSIANLCHLRESLSDPYEIVFSIKRVNEKETQFILNNKSKREESGGDLKSHKKYLEAQKALEEIDNHGKKIFLIEFSVILWFPKTENAQQVIYEAKSELSQIGEFGVEDIGLFPSFVSTLQGGKMHISNIEMTDRIPSFFPILVRGRQRLNHTSDRSLLIHRQDDSVDQIDLFDANYSNFSMLCVGRSGLGKSVFVNTLLQSLLNDKKLKIILVDVKGSHTNSVRNLSGTIHKIGTSNNTTISPFNFLRENKSKDVIEIISDFMEKLLIESHETHLIRTEQARLEESLVEYINKNPSNPSLDDYVNRIKNIPRSESLKRWQREGIYGSVFSEYNQKNVDSRIQYFDFTNIITAQKGGVGPAVMSAIMAHFNYQLISKKTDEKLVFIADETPFFIKSCFSSFNLLMKNVRKLNGSLVLIAQNLSDLVVEKDTSLVNQAELRIFFSKDSGNDQFKELSGLSDEALNSLDNTTTLNGRYSQFIVRDSHTERIGKLRLSKEEYFRSTTLASDRHKIEEITKLFGFKDENKAIEILADIGNRYEITN